MDHPGFAYLAALRGMLEQSLAPAGVPLDGITGFGVGAPGQPGGLYVYVESLSHPVVHVIPSDVNGVRVWVRQSGRFSKSSIQSGVSIGHRKVTAGTLGGLVVDEQTGETLIMGNNHVLAAESRVGDNRAKAGDSIVQPGPIDGGTRVIAHLLRWQPLRTSGFNEVDAALARPVDPKEIDPRPRGITRYSQGMGDAVNHSLVIKSGRTTGLTSGNVLDVDANIYGVEYGEGSSSFKCNFRGCVITQRMSAGGDSGSFLYSQDGRYVLGLLFAGSDEMTVYNPAETVARVMGIRFPDWNTQDVDTGAEEGTDSGPIDGDAPGDPSGGGEYHGAASSGAGPIIAVAVGAVLFALALEGSQRGASD